MILDPPEWIIAWLTTVNLWEILLFAAAAVAALLGAKRFAAKGWPALKRLAAAILNLSEFIEAARGLPEFMQSTEEKIGQIHHEVHFNNGGSVKDAVVRVERTSERLEEGVRGVHERLDGVDGQLVTVATDIAELRRADAQLRKEIGITQPTADQGADT